MKYILNKGRYAVSFAVLRGTREDKIILDRKRVYMDTGNIATTGITALEDDVYKALERNEQFTKLLEQGELELVSESVANPTAATEAAKDKEIADLKAELAKAKKTGSADKEIKAKDKEIADLKAKLEAMAKTNKEVEGF